MINFNELPNEIKELIFKNNRQWTSSEITKNKIKYNKVIKEFKMFDQLTQEYYIDVVMDGNPYPSEELLNLAPSWSVLLLECMKATY
jgi:cell wall assembly regulator SMI1